MRRFLSSLFVIIFISGFAISAFADVAEANDAQGTLNFVVNSDETAVVDQLLYYALRSIGCEMTMDATAMQYAIQMANSGERDALATQTKGLEANFQNLVMIPEPVWNVSFEVFVRDSSDISIRSWDDLAGLRVGYLFQKTYIINHLPENIAGSIQRETFYELNLALIAGECDAIITSSYIGNKLVTIDGVKQAGNIDPQPSYTYLNKKHEALVPALSSAIVQMKADGTYDQIVNGEFKGDNHKHNVLHISSYYPEDVWDARIKEGILEVLDGFEGDDPIYYYNIPLYSNRFRTEAEQAKNAYHSFRTMSLTNPPDVLIVSDNNALSFVCNYYSTLFNGVPIVLCDINGEVDRLWMLGDNYTGIWETISVQETVAMIKTLFPNTTEIYVVNDYTRDGQAWHSEIKALLGISYEGMTIRYNDDLPHDALLDQIASLPETAAVLLGNYLVDSKGVYFSHSQINTLICKRTSLPVFGMLHCCIGDGQVGGKYVDPIISSKAAAKIAVGLITDMQNGKDIFMLGQIRDTATDNIWRFDEQVLAKRGIDTKLIPASAELINHKLSMQEANPQAFKLAILAAILAVILIVILSAFMLVMHRKNRHLNILANTDSMTGLLTRRYFMSETLKLVDEGGCLILFDIDKFKNINDVYGHAGGDDALIEITRILSEMITPRQLFARHGGEEFLVFQPGSTLEEAAASAENMRSVVAAHPFKCNGTLVNITASFGVAALGADKDVEAATKRADEAMYTSKIEGRNRVTIF